MYGVDDACSPPTEGDEDWPEGGVMDMFLRRIRTGDYVPAQDDMMTSGTAKRGREAFVRFACCRGQRFALYVSLV